MGQRGPVPNRDADLARPRDRKGADVVPVTQGELLDVVVPAPDPEWHSIARMVWDGALSSGQAGWYQNSDLAILYSLCDDLSMYKKPLVNRDGEEYYKRSGQMLQTIMASLSSLLLTEGDRRRVRLELAKPQEEQDAQLIAIEGYLGQLEEAN